MHAVNSLDWEPVIIAIAAQVSILGLAVAAYIQGHATRSVVADVKEQTNGLQTQYESRLAKLEGLELAARSGAVQVVPVKEEASADRPTAATNG